MQKDFSLTSEAETKKLAGSIAKRLKGGEVFELSGDVGVGKTVFVKALAEGLGITETVQSPTFTISRIYEAPRGLEFHHYDFYRLNDPGIMREELAEALKDMKNIVAIEWDENVRDVLPAARTVSVAFSYTGEHSRKLRVTVPEKLVYILEEK